MKKALKHDFYFKKLLGMLFPDFIELFFPEMLEYLDRSSIQSMDKELLSTFDTEQVNEADLVMKVRFKNRDSFFLVLIETQAQVQAHFPLRLFFYFSKLLEKYQLPVYPIVVYSFDKPLKEQPSCLKIWFSDMEVLQFNYRCVQLNQLQWKDYQEVCNPVAAALMAKMRIAPSERACVKLKCMSLLEKLKRDEEITRLVSGFIDTYLRLTNKEMEEYEIHRNKLDQESREAVMEIETSWQIKGRKEGRQEGMAMLLEKHLNRRFGSLPQEFVDKIQKLDSKKLLKLDEALLNFKAPADLAKWLAKHGSS